VKNTDCTDLKDLHGKRHELKEFCPLAKFQLEWVVWDHRFGKIAFMKKIMVRANELMRFDGAAYKRSEAEFRFDGEQFMFSVDFPEFKNDEDCSMAFFLLVNSLEEFMMNFSVNDVRRIKETRLETLWLMFFDGRIELICRAHQIKDHFLFFRIEKGVMKARDISRKLFKVKKPLGKTEDFLKFTKEYFQDWEED
jgi:hypothetical protein